MAPDLATTTCAACGRSTSADVLAECKWLPQEVAKPPSAEFCPKCCQAALSDWLHERAALAGAEGSIPFDEKGHLTAYGVLPAPMQLGADPRFTGRGVTLAMIDSGFFPHPDLAGYTGSDDDDQSVIRNRIRAWADTSTPSIRHRFFGADESPRWPGWDRRIASQWHGMMTAAAAAGTGAASHGWYCGFAPEADLVFVQTWDTRGRITNNSVARALRWLLSHRKQLELRIVNLSVGGDPVRKFAGNFVDAAVHDLIDAGVTVVAATGNKEQRRLSPPATAPGAITVSGLDTRNSPEPAAWRLWHGNWGRASDGSCKPDLIAPSVWVAAPVLPGTKTAIEAIELFQERRDDEPDIEKRIIAQKLLTPHYQHVDGTSFAAAMVSGAIACMIQANPSLTPARAKEILVETAMPLPGAPIARQGAGALRPALAVARAISSQNA